VIVYECVGVGVKWGVEDPQMNLGASESSLWVLDGSCIKSVWWEDFLCSSSSILPTPAPSRGGETSRWPLPLWEFGGLWCGFVGDG